MVSFDSVLVELRWCLVPFGAHLVRPLLYWACAMTLVPSGVVGRDYLVPLQELAVSLSSSGAF